MFCINLCWHQRLGCTLLFSLARPLQHRSSLARCIKKIWTWRLDIGFPLSRESNSAFIPAGFEQQVTIWSSAFELFLLCLLRYLCGIDNRSDRSGISGLSFPMNEFTESRLWRFTSCDFPRMYDLNVVLWLEYKPMKWVGYLKPRLRLRYTLFSITSLFVCNASLTD